jgi:hypothetical protein
MLPISAGKFTQESQVLAKMEHEKELARMDPWKVHLLFDLNLFINCIQALNIMRNRSS